MTIKRNLVIAAFAALAAAGMATAASADTWWEHRHPRQDQVLDRVQNQRRDIRAEYREGDLSRFQEHRLLARDNRLAREDRFFARSNGGYITRGEQSLMDHRLNRIHRHIPG